MEMLKIGKYLFASFESECFVCLSLVQMMTYLKNLVKKKATATMTGLKISNNDYQVALNSLKKDSTTNSFLSHMKALSKSNAVVNIKDFKALIA